TPRAQVGGVMEVGAEARPSAVAVGFDGRKQRLLSSAIVRMPAPDGAGGEFHLAEVPGLTAAAAGRVYSGRVDTDDHSFITNGFVSHNTESRLDPLAMEMLRDIDGETVDSIPNYHGRG